MSEHRIPSSRADDFRAACAATGGLAGRVTDVHPIHYWRCAAKHVTSLLESGELPGDDADTAWQAFAELALGPAARLCRLARSLSSTAGASPSVSGARAEIAALAQPQHFFHSEYVLHLAAKASSRLGGGVSIVRTQPMTRTPDIAIEDRKIAIECVAHEGSEAHGRSYGSDFAHAQGKMRDVLNERPGWVGVLAVDLGFRGSPSFPNVGRRGPEIGELAAELDDQLGRHPQVGAVILTWVSVMEEPAQEPGITASIRGADVSGVRFADSVSPEHRELLEELFRAWPRDPLVARRTRP